MNPLTHASHATRAILATTVLFTGACGEPAPPAPVVNAAQTPKPGDVVIGAPDGTARPPFAFSPEDEAFLDEVQRSAFEFFWKAGAAYPPAAMAPDRTSKPTVSVAGVGFQLSALCVGAERGWVSRDEASARAEQILRVLAGNPENRKGGLFYHFIDPATGGQPSEAYEHVVSTIDSALLFAGILTASQYFGGAVRELGDALFADADWVFFVSDGEDPLAKGYISLGWKPAALENPTGPGALLPYAWIDSGDEHRLVTFLAVCAPVEARRVDPALYYRLRRQLGAHGDTGPMVWFPWSGALFTNFFAHCWIDYAGMGPDTPRAFGIANRSSVDWWENSRRAVRLHRLKAIENPKKVPTLGVNAWGLTASDYAGGYAVPGVFPEALPMPGAIPQLDYPVFEPTDDYGDGTIAPYGAGSSVMFEPEAAVAALRYYRGLRASDGSALVWRDPADGGYGFLDAFNLGTNWVASDYVAIDQGPLLLAIENARSGLIWRVFHEHPYVKEGTRRLRLDPTRERQLERR